MPHAIPIETSPMEARTAEALPTGPGWQFEPKWDGFRCIAFKHGSDIDLRGKSGKSLARWFPEMMAALAAAPADQFVLDGELVIPAGGTLSFAALQDRLHPAASRIQKLGAATPALLILFDALATGPTALVAAPLPDRRAALERLDLGPSVRLTPYTHDPLLAAAWLAHGEAALDGVVAKRLDAPYQPGERAMLKVKRHRTADCVVGGFRTAAGTDQVGSLLLGLYDHEGRLDHVGFTSAIAHAERAALTARLTPLIEAPGFTGAAPGGPSRWSTDRSADWRPLRAELVIEVRYDQVTGGRFRHGTALLRWRPDKLPRQCTRDQLQLEATPARLVAGLM